MSEQVYVCQFCDADVPHAESRIRDGAICCKACRFGPEPTGIFLDKWPKAGK